MAFVVDDFAEVLTPTAALDDLPLDADPLLDHTVARPVCVRSRGCRTADPDEAVHNRTVGVALAAGIHEADSRSCGLVGEQAAHSQGQGGDSGQAGVAVPASPCDSRHNVGHKVAEWASIPVPVADQRAA